MVSITVHRVPQLQTIHLCRLMLCPHLEALLSSLVLSSEPPSLLATPLSGLRAECVFVYFPRK